MPFQIQVQVAGLRPLLRKLDDLKRGARNRILRPAIAKAARIIVKQAKRNAPKDSGALRRSLTSVIRIGRKSGQIYAVIGPETGERKDRQGSRSKTRFGKWLAGQGIPNRPANYAHLVEFGRASVSVQSKKVLASDGVFYGRSVRASEPRPFLRPALLSKQSEVRSVLKVEIWAGLKKHYAKARARAA